jgi:hypothetical protein
VCGARVGWGGKGAGAGVGGRGAGVGVGRLLVKSSGRTPFAEDVLKESWVSIISGSGDYSFKVGLGCRSAEWGRGAGVGVGCKSGCGPCWVQGVVHIEV